MRELPKAYNPQGAEENLYKLWEESGFFAPEAHRLGRVVLKQIQITEKHSQSSCLQPMPMAICMPDTDW